MSPCTRPTSLFAAVVALAAAGCARPAAEATAAAAAEARDPPAQNAQRMIRHR